MYYTDHGMYPLIFHLCQAFQQGCSPYMHKLHICSCKGLFIHHKNTKMFSPNCLNPGVQNIYPSTACMIMCVLYGSPVLGATCIYWE